MSLFGGIISGALQGAGDAGQQVAAQQAKVWDQEAINQQLANLDVQKQASLMALQFQQKQRAMQSLYPDTTAVAPAAPTQPATPVAEPVAAPTQGALPTPPDAIDTSGGWDSINAQGKAQQPQADAMSVAMLQNELKNEPDPQNRAALQRSIGRLGGSSVADSAQPTAPAQIAPAPAAPSSTQGVAPVIWHPSRELMQSALSADIISPGAGSKLLEANAPDATGKALLASGVSPGSPEWTAGYKAHMFKENSENVRPGGIVMSGGKPIFAAPSEGIVTTFDDQGRPVASLEPGFAGAKATTAAAQLAATNTQNLAPVAQSPVDASGRVIPVSIAGALSNGASGTGAGLAPGQAPAADAAQKELSDKWTALNGQNQNAQSTVSLLQNIKTQAQKAAVGPASDRIDFANGLLSLVGNEKAKDAVTANDLLDKYSNQIVAKLGQGGLGTDAGRAIVAAGNPNSHMNLPAINEAVDNLVGATQQAQAKAQILSPYAAKRDPVGYQNAELSFDKVADPRIFQWKNIQNPQQQAAFLQNVATQDPGILKKIAALQTMGALQ